MLSDGSSASGQPGQRDPASPRKSLSSAAKALASWLHRRCRPDLNSTRRPKWPPARHELGYPSPAAWPRHTTWEPQLASARAWHSAVDFGGLAVTCSIGGLLGGFLLCGLFGGSLPAAAATALAAGAFWRRHGWRARRPVGRLGLDWLPSRRSARLPTPPPPTKKTAEIRFGQTATSPTATRSSPPAPP